MVEELFPAAHFFLAERFICFGGRRLAQCLNQLAGEHIRLDGAFAALHGSPLEDGKMQGYFDMLGLPYTCCDGYVSALTMNKHATKQHVAPLGVPVAKSVLLRRGEPVDEAALLAMGLPLFVKPNTHCSSFGVTKVKTADQLLPAI